jgi:hypothetical protein
MLYGNNQDANSVRANVQLVTRVSDDALVGLCFCVQGISIYSYYHFIVL